MGLFILMFEFLVFRELQLLFNILLAFVVTFPRVYHILYIHIIRIVIFNTYLYSNNDIF